MKKIVICCFFLLFITSVSFANTEFVDINNHWAKSEINTLITNNSIDGYSDGTFRPDDAIRVDEFLKILVTECDLKLKRQGSNWGEMYAFAAEDYGIIKDNSAAYAGAIFFENNHNNKLDLFVLPQPYMGHL